MNDYEIVEIVKKINKLTDNNPLGYLEKKSTWFSETFVSVKHKNVYPYYDDTFDDFFLDNKIAKLDKEVGLKFVVNQGLNNSENDIELISNWIIKTWGGIKGISNTTIVKIVDNIDTKNYAFQNISSWSKVHSFKYLNTHAIYDSKVVYSANWLLLNLDTENKFFVQPEGRNKRLTTFPMNAIINFKNSKLLDMTKRGGKAVENVYLSEDKVYEKYLQLISLLNDKLWGNSFIDLTKLIGKNIYLKDYLFFTELLLFNMADDVIVEDVRKNIFIAIKQSVL